MFDRPHFFEELTLVVRQHLGKHAEHGIDRQRAGRQLDLAPRQRPAEGAHGRRTQQDVRLLADVHDERVAVQANDGVEERVEKRHCRVCFGW